MASPPESIAAYPPLSIEAEKNEQKRIWHRFSRWIGRNDQSQCPERRQETEPIRPGLLGRRLSRKVVPGLPRPVTFRRQNSERREHLTPVEPRRIEPRSASVDRRRAMSARPPSPCPVAIPKLSAPAVCEIDHGPSHVTPGSNRNGSLQNSDQQPPIRPAPPLSPPPDIEPDIKPDIEPDSELGLERAMTEASYDDDPIDAKIKAELEEKWILNLSMHFRDRSPREKFFITYAEIPTRWRRVTVSCDYRDAPPDSLERDLQALQYQRDKSARIYEAIRMSLPDIQFYNTVTNLKLETSPDDRLHVHVTEDANEIIPYPSVHAVQHLHVRSVRESEVNFEAHMSGFVYRVKVNGQVCIKKEIPGPDSVDEFLYEINALYSLIGSKNVIQFRGLVVDERNSVIKGLLIDYAEQGPLVDTLFDYKGTLPWARRERWAAEIVQGLSEIHEAGFVQGDFTLSNIVIDEDNRAQIIDINRRGCPVGWEPPEIARLIESSQRISMYIGVKSDLFQLGMVLWALAEEEDEPERQPRPLTLSTAKTDIPPYFRNMVLNCLSECPKDRSAAKDLLSSFPKEPSEPSTELLRRPIDRHLSLSLPSETRYIDPADAVEREDLDLHHRHPVSGALSSDSHTYVDRPGRSIDGPFDGPGSYVVPRRGRQPAVNMAHLEGRDYGTRSREISPDDSEQGEPQIVSISPTGEHRWQEFQLDGKPYIVQKDYIDFDEDVADADSVRTRQDRSLRRLATGQLGESSSAEGMRHVLSMAHVDSGLADMDLTGVGGHEALKYDADRGERGEIELDTEEREGENGKSGTHLDLTGEHVGSGNITPQAIGH